MNRLILLVEDDAEDAEIIGLALEKSKCAFDFVHVVNGEEAMRYLAREGKYLDEKEFPRPSLVLLDLSLPGFSGFDVLRWMQAQAAGTMPPVVVLSYSDLERDVKEAHELGAKFFLRKSVALEGTVGMMKALEHFWKADLARGGTVAFGSGGTELPVSG